MANKTYLLKSKYSDEYLANTDKGLTLAKKGSIFVLEFQSNDDLDSWKDRLDEKTKRIISAIFIRYEV